MPELGYQEVYLARAFTRLGLCSKVFTSTKISPTGRKILHQDYPPGICVAKPHNYEILRLKPFFSLRSKVLARGLRKKIKKFNPDIILILAIAKLFPVSLLSSKVKNMKPGMKIISFFGDAAEYIDRSSFGKKIFAVFHTIGFCLIKKKYYQKALRICDHLVLNVPETETIFRGYLKKKADIDLFNAKKINLNLGFDPEEFYFEKKKREEIRKELGILEDECVIITSTRVNKRKNLEAIIDIVSKVKEKGIKVRYIIIGFLGDTYERELKKYISRRRSPGIFHCYPFMDHMLLREFYCSGDIGIWTKAAISIQEAMGTGLPILLEDKPSVNHLVYEPINGWLFKKDNLEKVMQDAIRHLAVMPMDKRLRKRYEIEKFNHREYSYDRIAREIITRAAATKE